MGSLIIADNSTVNIDRLFRLSTAVVLGCLALILLGFFYLHVQKPWERRPFSAGLAKMAKKADFPYATIGTGPLSLHPRRFSNSLSRLMQEVIVVARNMRPDVAKRDASLLIRLKSSGQEAVVPNGMPVFLSYEAKGDSSSDELKVSSGRTALWVKPILLDRGGVLLEFGREIVDSNVGGVYEEKGEFVIQEHSLMGGEKKGIPLYEQAFKDAKVWGQDVLYSLYGGEEYRAIRDKVKVEFPSSSICFVSEGDYLRFYEGRWEVVPLEKARRDLPVAYVKALSLKGVELETWDESGFYPETIKLPLQVPSKLHAKMEQMPGAIRQRNATQVTCLFGKRRVILKKGDWILRTQTGWHSLKRLEDVENYLQHKLKGELFIFDSLQKEGDKTVLKGQLFDEMRTQVTSVSLPVIGEMQKHAAVKKKGKQEKKL